MQEQFKWVGEEGKGSERNVIQLKKHDPLPILNNSATMFIEIHNLSKEVLSTANSHQYGTFLFQ